MAGKKGGSTSSLLPSGCAHTPYSRLATTSTGFSTGVTNMALGTQKATQLIEDIQLESGQKSSLTIQTKKESGASEAPIFTKTLFVISIGKFTSNSVLKISSYND